MITVHSISSITEFSFLSQCTFISRLAHGALLVLGFEPALVLALLRREGSTWTFRNRIACPDDAGHRDVTSCETREVWMVDKV